MGGLLLFMVGGFKTTSEDRLFYERLMENSTLEKAESLINRSKQTRQEVSKKIWYQEEGPLFVSIKSADSELFFFHQGGTIEVVEHLENVTCLMQEELYYLLPGGKKTHDPETGGQPMQLIRFVEADKACYHYNTQLFLAEDVKISRYCVEGHTPVSSLKGAQLLMKGVAQRAEFTLQGDKLDFQAHRMKAEFFHEDKQRL